MTVKQTLRIVLDCSMTILLICAYAYRITGDTAHEWVGVSASALFIAHNIINCRGKYTLHRVIICAVNIALALTIATLIITGLLQSRAVLAFLHLPGGMVLRLIHTAAAYWLVPLIGLHLGLHWGLVTRRIGKNCLIVCVARIAALVVVAFGVWSSFDRDMFSKLFLGFSFDYWPIERPALLFFAEILSVIAIYVFVVYYALKRLEQRRKREKN